MDKCKLLHLKQPTQSSSLGISHVFNPLFDIYFGKFKIQNKTTKKGGGGLSKWNILASLTYSIEHLLANLKFKEGIFFKKTKQNTLVLFSGCVLG